MKNNKFQIVLKKQLNCFLNLHPLISSLLTNCPSFYILFIFHDIKQLLIQKSYKPKQMEQLFIQVLGHFQSNHQYDKFIKQTDRQYDIKIYRLSSFSRQYAHNIFRQLLDKYNQGQLNEFPLGWHQNQRRLYVWFIVCFIHMKMLEPNKLVDHDKYWKNISLTFHNKQIPFLKYQLLTIIKNKGRTHWKQKQDQLLKQAYQHFEHGQWNQIAKYFYIHSRGQFFKTAKQCRERWQNHLNQRIVHGDWTQNQDIIILQHVKKHGTKWANMIQQLGGTRTQHMIKNRYKSLINKAHHKNKNLTQGQAVLQLLKDLSGPQNVENVPIVRDQQGILQCQSQQLIDQEPPVIEKKTRKEKKRGRPKKVVEKVQIKNQSVRPQKRSVHMAPSINRSFNFSDVRFDNPSEPMIDAPSQSRINPMLFNNSFNSNIFLNDSRNDFFRGGFSINNNQSFIKWGQNDNASLFLDPMMSRNNRQQPSFEPVMLGGQSLLRSRTRKMSAMQSNDSRFFSSVLKDAK